MKLTPVGERVVIRPLKVEERTKGGIYIPQSSKEEKKEGEILEIGEKDSEKFGLKKGDKILYGGYSSDEFEIDGEKFIIIELKDVLARLE